MIPIFSSHYSPGRSILTLDEPEEIKDDSTISVFSIAKKYDINPLYLVDSYFCGFIKAYQVANDNDIDLRFGIKMLCCDNMQDKSEESFVNESKIIVFIKESQGYYDLASIYSRSWIEGKYYKNRIDWKTLNEMWTDNLGLCIPFYDSFLHNNLLENSKIIPIFPSKPKFLIADQNLPFDQILKEKVIQYTKENKFSTEEVSFINYFRNEEAEAAQTYRLATGRSEYGKASLEAPQLEHWASNKFSFEYYLNKQGKNI